MRVTGFSAAEANASPEPRLPSAKELFAMGTLGRNLQRHGRVALMNQIGGVLGIPPGGFQHQAKLFEGDDIRLRALLGRLAHPRQATLVAGNLERASRFARVNTLLVLVTAAREGHASLTATGDQMIDSYYKGGLDFLAADKRKLGLPRSITAAWKELEPFVNAETIRFVRPAEIPARDQVLVYAAQLSSTFQLSFKRSVAAQFGEAAEPVIARACRISLLIWQAYAFLAPGGGAFQSGRQLTAQLSQRFGVRTALSFVAHQARQVARRPELDAILEQNLPLRESLAKIEWVRSAKTRTAETLFLEFLLTRAREVLAS